MHIQTYIHAHPIPSPLSFDRGWDEPFPYWTIKARAQEMGGDHVSCPPQTLGFSRERLCAIG